MDLVIREAAIDDAEELGAAHVAAWQAAYPGLIPDRYLAALDPIAGSDRWRQSIANRDSASTTLVAEVGGRIAGFTSYGSPRDQVPDGWGEVWAINLHPDYWRQRIGTALFRSAVTGLIGRGYRHGYLWVLQGNERAIGFYRRQGWPADGDTKIDDQFDPPRFELRCSAALGDSAFLGRG